MLAEMTKRGAVRVVVEWRLLDLAESNHRVSFSGFVEAALREALDGDPAALVDRWNAGARRPSSLNEPEEAAVDDPAATEPRRIYSRDGGSAALRVEISRVGMHARDVATVAIDDPKFGADRERPVRIVVSPEQAASLAPAAAG